MASNHTGNQQPSIDLEEHRSVNGVNAKATVPYSFDGANLVPSTSGSSFATLIDDYTTTSVTYIGKAAPGSATTSAVWQIMKIDETTGTVIKWADGNSNFDNVWGALPTSGTVAGLSYS